MDRFHLYCASEHKDALIESLDMFHFGEDLTLRALGEWVSLLLASRTRLVQTMLLSGAHSLTQWRGHQELTLDLRPNRSIPKQPKMTTLILQKRSMGKMALTDCVQNIELR